MNLNDRLSFQLLDSEGMLSYLAMMYGVDPTRIPNSKGFKKEMDKAGE